MKLEIGLKYKKISNKSQTYFIADIAANHDGDLSRAKELIKLAAEAGADCAKFQHFKANKIVSRQGFSDLIEIDTHQSDWKKPVDEIYDQYHTRAEWDSELISTCEEAGIEFMTTPYDIEAVHHYANKCMGLKIGSGDVTYHQLISAACETGLPIFIASGAANLYETEHVVRLVESYGNPVCLFQCNTNYSGSRENFRYVNLNVLKQFAVSFPNVILGLSDHTPGHSAVLGAVALGARVIEKHFTDDNNRIGPDHKFALNPVSWNEMVQRTRELELALGDGIKRVEENEENTIIVQRRAVRAGRALPANHIVTERDLEFLRPCPREAYEPHEVELILGKKIVQPMKMGEAFLKA